MNDIFEKIYRDYFNGVYAFIFKLTRDCDLSEELSQETFYQAFLSFRRFKGNCDIVKENKTERDVGYGAKYPFPQK